MRYNRVTMGPARNRPAPDASNGAGERAEGLERDLAAAARAGDRAAFKALAERYYRRVYRMLLAMTRSEDAAMDLTQETFMKALQGMPSFNMSSSFYTWLYRIASNAALDRMRRARTAGAQEEYDDALDRCGGRGPRGRRRSTTTRSTTRARARGTGTRPRSRSRPGSLRARRRGRRCAPRWTN
ncbi:MAG: RNA polymerase sigma factor [Deltaproteobacteria bacterium]|nr:RNA polymerase sigma factor [Deltaproteobacteria bacterium]